MEPAPVTVRRGTTADAWAVASIRVRSWRWAYRGLVPDALLDGLSVEDSVEGWRLGLARQDRWVLLAERDGRVVGFVAAGPARDPDVETRTGEIYAIYLEPSAAGTGIGRLLMAGAVDQLEEAGFDSAILWVLEANERARAFYEREGWRPDGCTKDDDWSGHVLSEVRYALALPTIPRRAS